MLVFGCFRSCTVLYPVSWIAGSKLDRVNEMVSLLFQENTSVEPQNQMLLLSWICWARMLGKSSQHILPNGGSIMVIYHPKPSMINLHLPQNYPNVW